MPGLDRWWMPPAQGLHFNLMLDLCHRAEGWTRASVRAGVRVRVRVRLTVRVRVTVRVSIASQAIVT